MKKINQKINQNYKNILLTRALVNDMIEDENQMPIIKKSNLYFNINKIKLTNFSNIKAVTNRSNTIIDLFNNDDVLNSLWNNPIKYVTKFDGFMGVLSPDYSVYPNMSKYLINYNVYKSRYIGAFYQSFGINIIPTISWAKEDSYDVCFSGVEKESVVAISTLGTSNAKECFLNGFNEMKRRLKPSVIIVLGKIYEEMTGEFLLYTLHDTFNPNLKNKDLRLFDLAHHIIKRDGETIYGW